MDAAIQSFLAGIPYLLSHFAATLAMLALACAVYVKITPHDELALVRAGNTAAAVSLAGAILGLAVPLALCLANSVDLYDIAIWGMVTLVVQILVFRLADLVLKDLPRRIEQGELGAAILLAATKLAVGALTAAAVSG